MYAFNSAAIFLPGHPYIESILPYSLIVNHFLKMFLILFRIIFMNVVIKLVVGTQCTGTTV